MCFWIIEPVVTLDDINKRKITNLERFKKDCYSVNLCDDASDKTKKTRRIYKRRTEAYKK